MVLNRRTRSASEHASPTDICERPSRKRSAAGDSSKGRAGTHGRSKDSNGAFAASSSGAGSSGDGGTKKRQRPCRSTAEPDGDVKKQGGTAAAGGGADKYWSEYYLFKSEPSDYSVDDLAGEPSSTTCWEGVRNFRARNIMRAMQPGQRAFFYHSCARPPAVVGVVEIVRGAYADYTQYDASSKYHDAAATEAKPRWDMVDFRLVRKLERPVTLDELKVHGSSGGPLAQMQLLTAARLSVQNVSRTEWEFVLGLERAETT